MSSYWYYGLADCHGVESFVPDIDDTTLELLLSKGDAQAKKSNQYAMSLRAMSNAQRFAVVYRVLLAEDHANEVEELLKQGKYIDALHVIKNNAEEVQLSTMGSTKSASEKRWRMIPNPDLDPFHS